MITKEVFIFVIRLVILFAICYGSHYLLGKNNPIEEVAEDLLKKEYDIDVEFNGSEK